MFCLGFWRPQGVIKLRLASKMTHWAWQQRKDLQQKKKDLLFWEQAQKYL